MQQRVAALVAVLMVAVAVGTFAQTQAQQTQQADRAGLGRDRGPAQTVIGPTGSVVTPTAEVIGDRRVQLGYHAFRLDRGRVDFSVPEISVAAGPCWEFSGAYFDVGGHPGQGARHYWPIMDEQAFVWGFKLKLLAEHKNSPAVALGVWDAGDAIDLSAYAVATKHLFPHFVVPVKVSAGVASGDEVFSDFFGSIVFQPRDWLDWVVEHDGHKLNMVWRFYPWEHLLVEGGWQDLMDSQWIGGASWYWDY